MSRLRTAPYVFFRQGKSNAAVVADKNPNLYNGWRLREMIGKSFHQYIKKKGWREAKERHHIVHPVTKEVTWEYYWDKPTIIRWMAIYQRVNPDFLKTS